MDDKHIGSVISADTTDGSVYQGKLTTLDPNNGNITMASVCKDGLPLNRCVTLSTHEISHLRVIRPASGITPAQQKLPQRPLKKPIEPSLSSGSSSLSPPSTKPMILPPRSKGKTPAKKSNLEKLFESASPVKSNKPVSVPKPGRHSPKRNGFTHVSEEISATPLFKSFERQVPQPKVLQSIVPNGSSSRNGCSKKQGPSGNPVLDALNHYKGIGGRNKTNLAEPIDFDLESDFDFAENLKLFEKDEEDDEYFENVEKLKVSQNFAHYENIVDDVARVTSWTNLKARSAENSKIEKKNEFQVTAVSFEKSMGGDPIPAISAQEKKEFLRECKSSLGEAVFDVTSADRLFQWLAEIQRTHGDSIGTLVVLASAANSVRYVRRLLTHLDKRRYNCHVFGKYPGEHFENVSVVDDVKMLPKCAPIICILSPEMNEDVESWLRSQSLDSTHFVCVESVPSILDAAHCHLLQFGCATNGLRHVEIKKPRGTLTFQELCTGKPEPKGNVLVDSAIADLGSPSTWFDEQSSKFISTAFATSFLVRLSQN